MEPADMHLIVVIKAQPEKLLRDQHEDDSAGQLQHTHTHTHSATHLCDEGTQNRPGRTKKRQGINERTETGINLTKGEFVWTK